MSLPRVLFLSFFFCFIAVIPFQAQVQAQETKPEIKHVPAPVTSAASGKEMFKAYCATCHGAGARGDGPAASALKVPPPDLTVLARNNGGKFPSDRVTSILRGQATVTAHGNYDMPVWGPVFWRMSGGHETEVQQRIANLTRYVETLQVK